VRPTPGLVLGPLLRYTGESDATVWVETDVACEVEVLGHRASTFEIEGHYYTLVSYLRRSDRYSYTQPHQQPNEGVTYKAVVTPVAKDVAGIRLDQNDSRGGLQQKVWFFEINN
jgi:hypothetical protein